MLHSVEYMHELEKKIKRPCKVYGKEMSVYRLSIVTDIYICCENTNLDKNIISIDFPLVVVLFEDYACITKLLLSPKNDTTITGLIHSCSVIAKNLCSGSTFYEDVPNAGEITKALELSLVRPAPIYFLQNDKKNQDIRELAKITHFINNLIDYPPSMIADACRILMGINPVKYEPKSILKICFTIYYELSNFPFNLNDKRFLKLKITYDKLLSKIDKGLYSKKTFVSPKNLRSPRNIKPKQYNLKQGAKLGEGVSGSVFKMVDNKKIYAVKKEEEFNYVEIAALKLMANLNSKYIVKIEDMILDDGGCFIMFEVGSYSLENAMKTRINLDSPFLVFSSLQNILSGLVELHNADVIHCDLKPANVVWFEESNRYKLIDLGLSNIMTSVKQIFSTEIVTPIYRAPELFDPDVERYDFSIDIWSFGIILYEIITRTQFVVADDVPGIFLYYIHIFGNNSKKPPNKPFLKEKLGKFYDFFMMCCQMDPKKRKTAMYLLDIINCTIKNFK